MVVVLFVIGVCVLLNSLWESLELTTLEETPHLLPILGLQSSSWSPVDSPPVNDLQNVRVDGENLEPARCVGALSDVTQGWLVAEEE